MPISMNFAVFLMEWLNFEQSTNLLDFPNSTNFIQFDVGGSPCVAPTSAVAPLAT